MNTGTTVVTFLVVFLIRNTQNRDARAIHLNLDEIINSIDQAQNEMIDIEHLSHDKLQKIAAKYQSPPRMRDTAPAGAKMCRLLNPSAISPPPR
jgi:low affinity Fe/Cu permease